MDFGDVQEEQPEWVWETCRTPNFTTRTKCRKCAACAAMHGKEPTADREAVIDVDFAAAPTTPLAAFRRAPQWQASPRATAACETVNPYAAAVTLLVDQISLAKQSGFPTELINALQKQLAEAIAAQKKHAPADPVSAQLRRALGRERAAATLVTETKSYVALAKKAQPPPKKRTPKRRRLAPC